MRIETARQSVIPEQVALPESKPYSDWVNQHNEIKVYDDDPRINIVIDDHAYLDSEDGHDPFVLVIQRPSDHIAVLA